MSTGRVLWIIWCLWWGGVWAVFEAFAWGQWGWAVLFASLAAGSVTAVALPVGREHRAPPPSHPVWNNPKVNGNNRP